MTFATKEDAHAALEAARAEWLAAARAWLRQYAENGRVVTVNDLRRYGPPIPDDIDPRVAGAVFAERGVWERLGYTSSTRRVSHGRPVARFRLVGA